MQDEFDEHKQKLLDKETKKRMLEAVWEADLEIEPAAQEMEDRETAQKKDSLKRTKKANLERRTVVREQAEALEQERREADERVAWTEGLELGEVSESVEKSLEPLLEKLKAKAAALLEAEDADVQNGDDAVALIPDTVAAQ